MRQKVEAHESFLKISKSQDGLGLLKTLKGVAYQFQSQKYLPHSIHEAMKRYYLCYQGKFTTTQSYIETFQDVVDVITHTGGKIAGHPGKKNQMIKEHGLTQDEIETNPDIRKTLEMEVTAQSTAMAFLLGADRSRFGKLIEDMENDFLQGHNNYPMTITAAYNLLTNWKEDSRYNSWRPQNADGVAFVNATDDRTDKRTPQTGGGKGHITCFKCGVKGHYATECPENGNTAGEGTNVKVGAALLKAGLNQGEFDRTRHFQFLQNCQVGSACHIGQDGCLPALWILLDNHSTVDVFCNHILLKDIRSGKDLMTIHCNAGVATTNMTGELKGYRRVWYHPDGIANILSIS